MRRALLALAIGVVAIGAGACGGPGEASDAAALDASSPCTTDAQCDDALFCTGTERCAPTSPSADARGCVVLPACGAAQICDEASERCTTDCAVTRDADGDSAQALECGGDDCDDARADVRPGAIEVCDRDDVDEDCDPLTFGERDGDGDGATDAACCNAGPDEPLCGTDCDDARGGVHPGEAEECDGLDGDCDGAIDERVQTEFTRDADGDGHATMVAPADTVEACEAPAGYALAVDDCDDGEASVHPGAYDRCDGTVDDDCSGAVDDPPAGCVCADGETRTCPLPGVCAGSTQACTEGTWGACALAATDEICGNDLDEDCDGAADDGCTCAVSFRACGIDEGACTRGVQRCLSDGVWAACIGSTAPSPEVCNGVDDDCDAVTDEGLTRTCWADPDMDDYATASAATSPGCGLCPSGTTARAPVGAANIDCDGDDARAHPGQTESFSSARTGAGGFDFDCDGIVMPLNAGDGMCRSNATSTGCELARVWYGSPSQCGNYTGWEVCGWLGIEAGCQTVDRCTPGIGTNCMRLRCR